MSDIGERILVRAKGDRTFAAGCLELVVLKTSGRFGVVANRGFEVVRQDAEIADEFIQNELVPLAGPEPDPALDPAADKPEHGVENEVHDRL